LHHNKSQSTAAKALLYKSQNSQQKHWQLVVSTIQDSELKVKGDKVPQSFAENHQRSDRPQFHGIAILIPAPEYLDLT
jgi:hypothetical protein